MLALSPYVRPIILLIGSNMFMTTAWYRHLRYKIAPAILLGFSFFPLFPGKPQKWLIHISFLANFVSFHILLYSAQMLTRLLTREHCALIIW